MPFITIGKTQRKISTQKLADGTEKTIIGESQPIKSIFDPSAIATLTDRELHKQAQIYGGFSRCAQKEFAAFLPEINKRKLYLKHKFYSIKHYAKVIGGLSEVVVEEILRVSKNLEDKPILQKLIIEQGWSKMRVIASVATVETQEIWAEKVVGMSKPTLEVFVRELKKQCELPKIAADLQSEKILATGAIGVEKMKIPNFLPGEEKTEVAQAASADCKAANSLFDLDTINEQDQRASISFKIDIETEKQLRLFKYKLEKKNKQPQNLNAVLKQLLQIAKEHGNCKSTRVTAKNSQPLKLIRAVTKQKIKKSLNEKSTRPIPAAIKQLLKEESGEMCEYPGCKNPAVFPHHLDRYKLIPNHDPEKIALLCKEHERLAHLGLIKNESQKPKNDGESQKTGADCKSPNLKNADNNAKWSIQIYPDKSDPKYKIDQIVNKFRRAPG